MPLSPTQNSLKLLRQDYDLVQVVEHWNSFTRTRKDLWCFDIIACKKDEICLVQTTSYSNLNARLKKITESGFLPSLREAGFRLLLHGWRKQKNRWTYKEIDVS